MNRLAFALVALFALGASAGAQVITNPNIADPIGCAYNTTPPTLTDAQAGWVQCDSTGAIKVTGATSGGAFPAAATPISGNATGTTGAVVGTLAGAASKTTYICGFSVSAIGGTAAVGPITVAGLVGASQVYYLSSSVSGTTMNVPFSPCIPSSAANTSITITTTANGTATGVAVNSWGYRQ